MNNSTTVAPSKPVFLTVPVGRVQEYARCYRCFEIKALYCKRQSDKTNFCRSCVMSYGDKIEIVSNVSKVLPTQEPRNIPMRNSRGILKKLSRTEVKVWELTQENDMLLTKNYIKRTAIAIELTAIQVQYIISRLLQMGFPIASSEQRAKNLQMWVDAHITQYNRKELIDIVVAKTGHSVKHAHTIINRVQVETGKTPKQGRAKDQSRDRIIDLVKQHNDITTKKAQELLTEYSKITIQNVLGRLVKESIIYKEKGTRYLRLVTD